MEIRRWVNSRVGKMVVTRRGIGEYSEGAEKISMSWLASPWRRRTLPETLAHYTPLCQTKNKSTLSFSFKTLSPYLISALCTEKQYFINDDLAVCTNLQTHRVVYIHYAKAFLYVKNLIKEKKIEIAFYEWKALIWSLVEGSKIPGGEYSMIKLLLGICWGWEVNAERKAIVGHSAHLWLGPPSVEEISSVIR